MEWFLVGVAVTAYFLGSVILRMKRQHEFEISRLNIKSELSKEVAKLRVQGVIVEGMKVWSGSHYKAPYRKPLRVIINKKEYCEGDQITEDLFVKRLVDHGAWTPMSPDVLLEPSMPDIQIGNDVFHDASMIDEWFVTIGVRRSYPLFEQRGLEQVNWEITTHKAKYQDGTNASLSVCNAQFTDGSPFNLVLPFKKQTWMY